MENSLKYITMLLVGLPLILSNAGTYALQTNQSHTEIPLMRPQYLYKILSTSDWKTSQQRTTLKLPSSDDAFIHLATKEQLERIIDKYWQDQPQFVLLKLDTSKLKGKLQYEANPNGVNQYYHLYNGSIPLDAIVEIEVIEN